MKLMVDNNLSPLLARGLGELFRGTHKVIHIKDKFGTGGLKDEDWIERLGKEGGWCVLSGDRQIAKRKPSRDLFLRAGLVGFFPMPAVLDLPLPKQAARILTLWGAMEAVAGSTTRGCYALGVTGAKMQQI